MLGNRKAHSYHYMVLESFCADLWQSEVVLKGILFSMLKAFVLKFHLEAKSCFNTPKYMLFLRDLFAADFLFSELKEHVRVLYIS